MTQAPPAPHLALYVSRLCGACYRVLSAIRTLNVPVEIHDVTLRPGLRNDIVAGTGRRTVPVLRMTHHDGRVEWMFESRDIIHYLREVHGDPA